MREYVVEFAPFAERHFIRTFAKKYKGAWDITRRSITEEFLQVELLFLKKTAETIVVSDDHHIRICKTEFKIAGSQESRHASGNRCIIAIHTQEAAVRVLLVYCKGDVAGTGETVWWRQLVKKNYPEYSIL